MDNDFEKFLSALKYCKCNYDGNCKGCLIKEDSMMCNLISDLGVNHCESDKVEEEIDVLLNQISEIKKRCKQMSECADLKNPKKAYISTYIEIPNDSINDFTYPMIVDEIVESAKKSFENTDYIFSGKEFFVEEIPVEDKYHKFRGLLEFEKKDDENER